MPSLTSCRATKKLSSGFKCTPIIGCFVLRWPATKLKQSLREACVRGSVRCSFANHPRPCVAPKRCSQRQVDRLHRFFFMPRRSRGLHVEYHRPPYAYNSRCHPETYGRTYSLLCIVSFSTSCLARVWVGYVQHVYGEPLHMALPHPGTDRRLARAFCCTLIALRGQQPVGHPPTQPSPRPRTTKYRLYSYLRLAHKIYNLIAHRIEGAGAFHPKRVRMRSVEC